MSAPDVTIIDLMIMYAQRKKLTDEQMGILEKFWKQSPEHQKLADQFGDAEWVKAELAKLKPAPIDEMWKQINSYLDEIGAPDDRDTPDEWEEPAQPEPRRIWRWVKPAAIAASAVICVWGGWLLYNRYMAGTPKSPSTVAVRIASRDFVPGDNEVVLIGNDGRKVEMNTKPNGTCIWWTKSAYVEKTDSNQLAMYGSDQHSVTGDGMNVFSDAIDRQADTVWQAVVVGKNCSPYFVRLPDGSNVWLRGGTHFWYPVGNGRSPATYIVQGKAFFDVKKDASRPFTVRTPGGGAIEVLGTSFLVDAAKENVSLVALLNGRVRVRSGADSAELRPAQEAVLEAGRVNIRPLRDSLVAMAWVEPSRYFHFNNSEFIDAVTAIASWYGYSVDNPQELRGITITDKLQKDPTPEGVLFIIGQIESRYLHIWVKDRVIHISKKPPYRK